MRQDRPLHRNIPLILLSAALLGACSHETRRENPVDPAVSPSVQLLEARFDSTSASVGLLWTRYDGHSELSHYAVLRKVAGLERVDTLARLTRATDTTFHDTMVHSGTEYSYRVAIVTTGGVVRASAFVTLSSYALPAPDLLPPVADSLSGHIHLRWRRYRGPGFSQYEISRGLVTGPMAPQFTQTGVTDTTWVDSTARPGVSYLYALRLQASGEMLESRPLGASYQLPTIELLAAEEDAVTATITLTWTAYTGPNFAGYHIRRWSDTAPETVVAKYEDVATTTHLDTTLDGNTVYRYAVEVRTTWQGLSVISEERNGGIYEWAETRELPELPIRQIQTMDMDIDAEGRIFAALSIGVVTSPDIIEPGLLIKFPDFDHYGAFFARLEHPVVHGVAEGFVNFVADPQTPLRIAAAEGNRAFVAAKEDGGTRMLVGSATIGSDSVLTEIWAHLLETDGAFPAGLHVEPDGRLLVISSDGMMYTFSDSGDVFEADRRLAASLSGDRALPVGDVVIGSGAGPGGNDQLFLVVNGRVEHQVLGRTRLAGGHIAGATHYDLGIGLENGYSLNPLGLAWSASTQRLAIIDAFARVQLLNVQPASGDPATYVTKWGDYGEFPGQFVVIPATAVSVSTDDMGRIYVADSSFRIQVFSP